MPNTQRIPDQCDTIAAKSRSTDRSKLPRMPGPEHERMNAFVGTWDTDGRQLAGPFGPAAELRANETYEWVTGGFFLVHRLDGWLGTGPMACVEVLGHDAMSQTYTVHSYYSDGSSNVMQAREHGGTWTFHGDWASNGELLKLRCTTVFGDDARSMKSTFDYSRDGVTWTMFWEARATRV
jgi:Protein of unknown function (DUF1579)